MARFLTRVIFFLIGVFSISIWAESLYDPTRPAPQFLTQDQRQAEHNSPFVLQSIFRSSYYQAAIINGQRVRIGELIGGYTLYHLTATQAKLKSPRGVCVLQLVPSFKKPTLLNSCNLPGDSQ